jgi:pyridoxamine 5'-phosphate oxidase
VRDDEATRLRALRRVDGLDESELLADPIEQFRAWHAEWRWLDPPEPDAAVLATSGADGRPLARNVLVRDVDHGFVWYTNYASRKGAHIAANPFASLVFSWVAAGRQVVVCGPVEELTTEESDAYFARRPRGSQLGAWASDQSRPVADRPTLDQRYSDVEARFSTGTLIPRPAQWGGYRLVPDEVELWQGRENRLHDRLAYLRADDGLSWRIERRHP